MFHEESPQVSREHGYPEKNCIISTPGPMARMLTSGQLSASLKSDQSKATPSQKTAQKGVGAVYRIEDAVMKTAKATEEAQITLGDMLYEIRLQGQRASLLSDPFSQLL